MFLYKHSVYARYRAPFFSFATLLWAVCFVLTLALPFFLAYASYGNVHRTLASAQLLN
jgi:hypothetical protein